MNLHALPIQFYQRDTKKVARELLGKRLFHKKNNQLTSGIIVETEAYLGLKDPACHTFNGRKTKRVESMYMMGGHSYVYLIYGLHSCFNVVTQNEELPEAVLIRSLVPVDGVEIMRDRRGLKPSQPDSNLCSGPGKLCQAMGIDRSQNGLLLNSKELWIEDDIPFEEIKNRISKGPRVGIDYAGEAVSWPLRFTLKD